MRKWVSLALALAMMVGVMFVLQGCTNAQEDDSPNVNTTEEMTTTEELTTTMPLLPGYSLEEIQGREGVYVKRDGRFLPMDHRDGSGPPWYHVFSQGRSFAQLVLRPDDELVFVGRFFFAEWAVYEFVGYVNRSVSFSHGAIRINHRNYTYLNGEHVGAALSNFVTLRDSRDGRITRVLRGERGENFAVSGWSGTDWRETSVSTNDRLYLPIGLVEESAEPTRYSFSFSVPLLQRMNYTTTPYGYFILNLPQRQSGQAVEVLVVFSGGGGRYVMRFEIG